VPVGVLRCVYIPDSNCLFSDLCAKTVTLVYCLAGIGVQFNAPSVDRWMEGWLGFNGILGTQVSAILCARNFIKFICWANGMCKRSYSFRMNLMEEIFDSRRLEAVQKF